MGDMGEFFRDWDVVKKAARETRLEQANSADLPDWSKHTAYHWSRDLAGQRLDWWPSTGRWSWGKKGSKPAMFTGTQTDLMNFITKRS